MISLELIKQLRAETGLGMMDCKQALEESKGSTEKAIELLKRKGKLGAARKSERSTGEGIIGAYIHSNGKIGALVELRCETDFVARSPEFHILAHDLAMHIAAANPRYLAPEDILEDDLAKERDIIAETLATSGKPPEIIAKIVDGKLGVIYQELCFLKQPFVKDQDKTVQDLLNEAITRFGENIIVTRFVRFHI